MMTTTSSADIGIIGGTGIYDSELFSNEKTIKVYTPFGDPSDLLTIGEFANKRIAFIPRHGKGHRIPPHRINYRANIWALREIGVKRIIAQSAVGSLRGDFKPEDTVFPDQFIDFTKCRQYSFYDGGEVCHVSVADPFCSDLRTLVIDLSKELSGGFHEKGTYICVEGPRFSTKSESQFFRHSVGGDVIGMTLVPECILAREAEICYLCISTVTDFDVWKDSPVSSSDVVEILHKNIVNTRQLISELIPLISLDRNKCKCGAALEDALL
jgi:5'-methylthioadenosine phosphorylase